MIPVASQPEPASFDPQVRQPGLAWLHEHGIALDHPLPANTTLAPYWRECLGDLHQAYDGICAYLCAFVPRVTGGLGVDHFVAKSRSAGLAYEWSNYRLTCSTMNSRKRDFSDVLDPFFLTQNLFRLQLSLGHIYPNPELPPQARVIVEQTIERLALDDTPCRNLRANWFDEYVGKHISSDYLRRKSPFVWQEAQRQGML
jgi:uncharacterized protein (TIGR02646 family)